MERSRGIPNAATSPPGLDADAFARLYDRYATELLAFFARRTYDPEAALDLLGETFASAFEARAQFRGPDPQAAIGWLYGVARHRLIDFQRRGHVQHRALRRLGVERREATDAELDRIEQLAATAELRHHVADRLAALPAVDQEILRLRIIEERPYADVADALGISEQSARTRTSRAVGKLRQSSLFPDPMEATDHARPSLS